MLVFGLTLADLLSIIKSGKPKVYAPGFSPFSEEFLTDRTTIYTAGSVVLICTGIFLFLLVPLSFVQIGNFLTNKSTNERFSKAPKKRSTSVSIDDERRNSTASAFTTTTSILAEQLVSDIGSPKRASGLCACFPNAGAMFCDSFKAEICCQKVGDQDEIYK